MNDNFRDPGEAGRLVNPSGSLRSSPAYAREPIDTSKLGPIKLAQPNKPSRLVAQVVRWEAEYLASCDRHWGDKIEWGTAREIAHRLEQVNDVTIDQQAAARRLCDDLAGFALSGVNCPIADSRQMRITLQDCEAIVALAVRRLVKGDQS